MLSSIWFITLFILGFAVWWALEEEEDSDKKFDKQLEEFHEDEMYRRDQETEMMKEDDDGTE